MRAMVLTAIGKPLELWQRPDTAPGPGEIRVRVEACVCGSLGRVDPYVKTLEIGMQRFGHSRCGAEHCLIRSTIAGQHQNRFRRRVYSSFRTRPFKRTDGALI
ncbi:MAG: hypothetical protein JSR91_16835 [Proteobacteria bacterium]|nr:hypothetical protein [Pseudomonadota bacterium]